MHWLEIGAEQDSGGLAELDRIRNMCKRTGRSSYDDETKGESTGKGDILPPDTKSSIFDIERFGKEDIPPLATNSSRSDTCKSESAGRGGGATDRKEMHDSITPTRETRSDFISSQGTSSRCEKQARSNEVVTLVQQSMRPETQSHDDTSVAQEVIQRVKANKTAKGKKKHNSKPPDSRPPKGHRALLELLDQNSPPLHAISGSMRQASASYKENQVMQVSSEAPDPSLRATTRSRQSRRRRPPDQPRRIPSIDKANRQRVGSQEALLHKTAAQQLAALTKANTKRNKTEACNAKNAPAESSTTNPSRKVPHKSVTWDKRLVYFLSARKARTSISNEMLESDKQDEATPLARRLRSRT